MNGARPPGAGRRDASPVPAPTPTPAPAPEELRGLLDVAFTDEQLAAVTEPAQPGLVVAGAGSGKTTVMAARVVWLVLTGAATPEQVLGLTFTNKAAAELAARVRAALRRATAPEQPRTGAPDGTPPGGQSPDDVAGEPTVATYHAYAGRLLVEHGLRLGLEPRARLLADATRFQLAGRVVRAARGPFPDLPWTVTTVLGRVVELEAQLSEHVLTVADARGHDDLLVGQLQAALAAARSAGGRGSAGLVKELVEMLGCLRARSQLLTLVEDYRRAKRRLDAVDFGDQLSGAVALAEQHPAVRAAERDRFRVVILDEYQDTSVAQRRMLAALFGDGHPVTAVGDPCQAIYGWRGASVANLDGFGRHFAAGPAEPAGGRLALSVNQRSGGRLLMLANTVAAPLLQAHRVRRLQPRAGAADGGDTVVALLTSWQEEARWVAATLAAELAERGLAPGAAAVLVRARADMPMLQAALTEAGLPVEVVGLGGLLTVPAVAELVALLTVLDEPGANVELLRLLAGPRWRVGRRDLQLLGRRARELVRADGQPAQDQAGDGNDLGEAVAGADPADLASLGEALSDPGTLAYSAEARVRFARLAGELAALRRHVGEPLLDLIARVQRVTGLEVELSASPESVRAGGAEALARFLDHAAAFHDLDGEANLSAFLAYLRAAVEHDRGLDSSSPAGSGAVALMTVHKAKGLEWDVVALPDLSRGVFPSTHPTPKWTRSCATLPVPLRGDWDPGAAAPLPAPRGWDREALRRYDQDHADHQRTEELRLAYVALTRARQLVIASGHWWGPTQKRLRGPSEVLSRIHEHCQAGHGVVAHWEPEPVGDRPALSTATGALSWPATLEPGGWQRRLAAADGVRRHVAALTGDGPDGAAEASTADAALTATDRVLVAGWDADLDLLLAEAAAERSGRRVVRLPASMTTSQLVALADDPPAFARRLARPMPRPPAPSAVRGTRFHAWVEAQFGLRPLLDADDLPGAQDALLAPGPDTADLAELQEAFRRGGWLARRPAAVEAPFELVLGGHVLRGRIDAVYDDGPAGWHVVDWKTGREPGDPLQLAVYRLAWARLNDVAPEQVRASFLLVRTGTLLTPPQLPGEAELVALLSRPDPPRPTPPRPTPPRPGRAGR